MMPCDLQNLKIPCDDCIHGLDPVRCTYKGLIDRFDYTPELTSPFSCRCHESRVDYLDAYATRLDNKEKAELIDECVYLRNILCRYFGMDPDEYADLCEDPYSEVFR